MLARLDGWWRDEFVKAGNFSRRSWFGVGAGRLRFAGARLSWCWYDLWIGAYIRPSIESVTINDGYHHTTVRVIDVYLIAIPTVVLRLRWAERPEEGR